MNCQIQNKCGGCEYMNVPYDEQLKIKTSEMNGLFKEYKVCDIIGMKNPLNYRNKGKYAFKNGKMGFFEENSHKIVYSKCAIQNEQINDIAEFVFEVIKKYKIALYDEDKHKGFLRHLIIRCGVYTGEVMVIFVTTTGKLFNTREICNEIVAKFPQVSSIVQNINDRDTNAILGTKVYKLYGSEFIYEKLGNLKFKISPLSFYQVNSEQMKVLYETAIKAAKLSKDDVVYDLYSGIGTISLCMANAVKQVYGIEIVADAVKDAIENAKINNVKNAYFIAGKVEENLKKLIYKERPDAVVVDPPRSGLDKKTIKILLDLKPKKIVYISCGPEALKGNLKDLRKEYKILKIQPVDMFPFTKHVENIAVLNLK